MSCAKAPIVLILILRKWFGRQRQHNFTIYLVILPIGFFPPFFSFLAICTGLGLFLSLPGDFFDFSWLLFSSSRLLDFLALSYPIRAALIVCLKQQWLRLNWIPHLELECLRLLTRWRVSSLYETTIFLAVISEMLSTVHPRQSGVDWTVSYSPDAAMSFDVTVKNGMRLKHSVSFCQFR